MPNPTDPTPTTPPESDEKTTPTGPVTAGPPPTGLTSWWNRLTRTQAADQKHREEREDKADSRVDKAYELALQAERNSTTRAWRIIYYQWGFISFLIVVIAAFAGHEIGYTIPGFGKIEVDAGDDDVDGDAGEPAPEITEEPAPAE